MSILNGSIQEIWRYTYINWPRIVEVKVPDYPDYHRELGYELASMRDTVDWNLIDDLDYEYFRAIEFFVTRANISGDIIIDLSFYDARVGPYWPTLAISQVVKAAQ